MSDQEGQEVEQKIEEGADKVQEEADRPEENYKAELARKNAEIARLRAEKEVRSEQPAKRDPADITTWSEAELKMLRNSNDPSVAMYKEQADELLLERKVKAIQAREYENRRKEESQRKLEAEHPESLDPSSDFSMKIEKVMKEYDLSRTPAGRLVAAKIVASEDKAANAKGQNKETDRVSRVKANMVDGDRPKPTEGSKDLESKRKSLADDLMSGREDKQVAAISQILKDKGMSRENFFKK